MVMAGWYPEDTEHIAGGPYYNTFLQVKTLQERDDVELHVVSRSRTTTVDRHFEENGVHFHFLGQPKRRLIPRQLSMIRKISSTMAKIAPDVVVSHDPTETIAAVRAGLPTAYIVHGIVADEMPHFKGLAKLRFKVWIALDHKAIRSADQVLCISEYGAKYCRELASGRISIIPYPIVEDMFFEAQPYSSGKAILFAGTMNYLKNPLTLVQAMPAILEKHPDAVLRICGRPADEEYIESIRRYIEANNLGESINILGVVSRREIIEMLSDSVCLALPSRQENAPNVVAQAMSAGRAVVATPVGGVPEMVDESVSGFLTDPDDSGAMADRIICLMDDADMTRRMGANARKRALAVHERHAHINSLMGICQSVLSSKKEQP